MKTAYIVMGMIGLLSACASSQERAQMRAQREIQPCLDRGLEEGSEAFDACRMQERAAAQQRLERRMDNSDPFRPNAMPTQMYRW